MDDTFVLMAIRIAVETIAVLETMKDFFKKKKLNVPAWIFIILSFLFSFGLALIKCDSFIWVEIQEQLSIGLLAFCITKLGYDSIWQYFQKKIKGKTNE